MRIMDIKTESGDPHMPIAALTASVVDSTSWNCKSNYGGISREDPRIPNTFLISKMLNYWHVSFSVRRISPNGVATHRDISRGVRRALWGFAPRRCCVA